MPRMFILVTFTKTVVMKTVAVGCTFVAVICGEHVKVWSIYYTLFFQYDLYMTNATEILYYSLERVSI
jgi:hypothetical protein